MTAHRSRDSRTHSRLLTGVVTAGVVAALAVFILGTVAHASTAYGTLNNFDVVNDTGQVCHGFEIELEDVQSTDVTYTYDWNHYGKPRIREDRLDPAHPRVSIRYESARSANGSFLAFTNVPTRALAPTDGHQCTNPAVNEGCEHFGVGYIRNPTTVRYFWLIDDGSGNLVRGPAVNVATPVWNVVPPAAGLPARVQARIEAPEPPPVIVKEFGEATWVKAIKTTTHNNGPIELKDLVSDDPDDPDDKTWQHGEPAEVETEWSLLQEEFAKPGGGNGALQGGDEDLPGGDEVVTRRYEFFKYAGPYDPETNEAMCDLYPDPNPIKAECATELLGEYIGAQMAGFNVAAVLGLIDHIEDGDWNEPYTDRRVVVGGNTPYVTTITAGAAPAGLMIDSATGILSGTPTAHGSFAFTVRAEDADGAVVSRSYNVVIAGGPEDPVPANLIVSALGGPALGAAGATVTVAVSTKNVGTAVAPASQSAVWISANKTLGGDLQLGARNVPPLAPGARSTGTVAVTLPQLSPGVYYLIAEADGGTEVSETSEDDNTRARKIVIGPDLTAAIALSPAQPDSTSPTTVTVTVKNVGGEVAGPTTTRLYRSANGTLDASDVVLGEVATAAIPVRSRVPAVFVLTLPAGTYHLIAQVDAAAAVAEVNEAKNTVRVKIVVP